VKDKRSDIIADLVWRSQRHKKDRSISIDKKISTIAFAAHDQFGNRVYLNIYDGCKLNVLVNGKRIDMDTNRREI